MKSRLMERHLRERQYLVVMEVNTWNAIKTTFPKGWIRPRVLLTTCKVNVTKFANLVTHPYKLQLLSLEERKKLLCRKAFLNSRCLSRLCSFRKEIIQKYGRLPLVILVLGGILRRKKSNQSNPTKKIFLMNLEKMKTKLKGYNS